jgi:hypothetical protein
MPNPTDEDTKQSDSGETALFRMANFDNLTLPLFSPENDVEANDSSSQMKELTPSAPIFMMESKTTNMVVSNISAAFVTPARSFKHTDIVNKLLEN